MRRLTSIASVLTVFLLFVLMVLALTSCARQSEDQKVDLQKEEQAVRSLSMKWLELWKAHNAASEAALFADDGIVFRENQEPVVGRTSIENLFTLDHKQNPKAVANWITDRVEVATSDDFAVEYGSWAETGREPSGTDKDHGKYITVYRKVNNTWKVAADISVSTKPEEVSK